MRSTLTEPWLLERSATSASDESAGFVGAGFPGPAISAVVARRDVSVVQVVFAASPRFARVLVVWIPNQAVLSVGGSPFFVRSL